MPKTEFRRERRIWWSECQKRQKDPIKEQKCCHCPGRREHRLQYVTKRSRCCVLLDTLKGIAEVVFLEMGEKFVENDFFKDFGQKWKVRNGTVVF